MAMSEVDSRDICGLRIKVSSVLCVNVLDRFIVTCGVECDLTVVIGFLCIKCRQNIGMSVEQKVYV